MMTADIIPLRKARTPPRLGHSIGLYYDDKGLVSMQIASLADELALAVDLEKAARSLRQQVQGRQESPEDVIAVFEIRRSGLVTAYLYAAAQGKTLRDWIKRRLTYAKTLMDDPEKT
jgi:hypothetical protein